MSIVDNKERVGRFTSSKIHLLIPQGKVKMTKEELEVFKEFNPKSRVTTKPGGFITSGLTYIKEKQLEKRMGASLDTNSYSQSTAWGLACETVIFSHLGLNYKMQSQETFLHPNEDLSKYWGGSVDLTVPDVKVAEIKCYQRKNFGFYADCLMQKDIELFRSEFAQEYWQIVSNSIIHNVDIGEAILFAPFESEMNDLREMIDETWETRFIFEKANNELPCLPDGGYYPNIVMFEFEIPQEDKDYLTKRVEDAIELLKDDKYVKKAKKKTM